MPHKRTYDPAICQRCNKSFLAARDEVKRGKGRFCSKACWNARNADRLCTACGQGPQHCKGLCKRCYLQNWKETTEYKPTPYVPKTPRTTPRHAYDTATCQYCGREFQARRDGMKSWCSRECAAAHRRQTGSCIDCGALRLYAKSRCKPCYNRWRYLTPDGREKALGWNHTRVAREQKAFVEKVDLGALYERDKGICGICHQKVERQKATLDHIWPLSRGGEHSYRNCQVAHFACNSRKHARGPGQMRLFG